MTQRQVTEQKASANYQVTRFNALRHGILSGYVVLPWEDEEEYAQLLAAIAAEHDPRGPTEEHLVEELSGTIWRKRRLRMAETATHRRGLDSAAESYRNTAKAALAHVNGERSIDWTEEAIRATTEDTAEAYRDLEEDEAMTAKALQFLGDDKADGYQRAVAALRDDTRDWWRGVIGGEFENDEGEGGKAYAAPPTADRLRRFLERQVLPWYAKRRTELERRPLIRSQAYGEALDPSRLERLARYEVQLDRKFERTLAMLIKLKDLRVADAQ